jgi:acyl dehydratase
MPIDPSNVGRRFPPTPPYEVEREMIRAFADAIGADHEAYRDPAAANALGYVDVIAPPTFVIVLTYAANLPILDEFGIALRNLLHGSQRFEYVRPIRAGDRLTCVVTIDGIRAVGGSDVLTTRGDVSAGHGEHVVTAWCSLVIREPVRGQGSE